MSRGLPLERGIMLRNLNQLQSVLGLNFEFVFVTEKVCVVGENAVISSARNWNSEGAVHVISKL